MDNGDWVFGRASAFDPSAKPELLDPDEVGATFVGSRFENPRNGQRNLAEFRDPFSPQLTPFRYIRTYNRAQAPGEWDPKRTIAESRRTPETPDLFPERPRPNALKHDTAVGGYLSYSIAIYCVRESTRSRYCAWTNRTRTGQRRLPSTVELSAAMEPEWISFAMTNGNQPRP